MNSTKTNHRSRVYLPTIYLGLADIYETILGTASQNKLTITVNNALTNSTDVTTYPPIMLNTNSLNSEAGLYDVYNVRFKAAPGYSYLFLITPNGIKIDRTKRVN
jgi:5-deoxy-D-glucuronate isomerase